MQNYIQEDSMVIDKIVYEVKSQGIFDQFRKECIADVDTKPAYQNLRQRVEGSVSGFLNKQKWSPDMNKNHVREMLRKNIYESGFLETGVERIVDQVVNPKINSIFLPKVSELVYKFFGIRHPTEEKKDSQSETLLPTDLEAVSPESDKHSEPGNIEDQTLDDSKIDEDESPPFEPLEEQGTYVAPEETSIDSHMSGFSGLISHDSNGHEISKPAANETSNQESITSKQSSDRLSIVMSDDNDTKMEIDEPKSEKTKIKDDKEKKRDDKNKDEKSHRSRHDSRSDKRDKDRKDSKDNKHRDHDKSKDRKDSSSRNGKSDKDKEKEKSKSHSSSSSSHRHSSSHRSHKDSSSSSRSKSKVSSSSSNKESSKDKYKDDKKKDSKRHHSSSSSSDKHKKDNHHSNHHSKTSSSSSRSKDKKDSKNKDKKDCESDTKKRSDRRSTDRDSNDGHSSLKSTSSSFESFSSNVQSSQQEKKSSNNTNSGDSGNSDMVDEVSSAVNLEEELSISTGEIKLFKPKFASNFQEAKRLMKIRKKLAQIENERNSRKLTESKSVDKLIKTIVESPPLPSVNVSAASWDALEAKLNETIANENCYLDESSYGSDLDEKLVKNKNNEVDVKDAVHYLKIDDSSKTQRYRDFLNNYIGKIEKKRCEKTKVNLRNESLKRKLDAKSDIKNNNKKFSIEVHENFSLPLSPAESDNSIDKKSDISEAPVFDKAKRSIKVITNSKHRYSSEDLYKPRLSFSSSRRRMKKTAGID